MEKLANLMSIAGTVMLGAGVVLKGFFYTVDAGQRAVIFDKAFGGVKETVVGEGMHFYIPFVQVHAHNST
jgi:prohibitin 1